jgi:hypothetical protein
VGPGAPIECDSFLHGEIFGGEGRIQGGSVGIDDK